MVRADKPDPRAEKVKRRKDRKRSLRSVTREIGIVGAITLALRTTAADIRHASDAFDDCPQCIKRQRRNVA